MSEFVDWGSDYRFSHDSIQRIMHNTHFLSICLYVFLYFFSIFSVFLFLVCLSFHSLLCMALCPFPSLIVYLSFVCFYLSSIPCVFISPLSGFNLFLFLISPSLLCLVFSYFSSLFVHLSFVCIYLFSFSVLFSISSFFFHPIIVGLFWSFLSFPYFTNQTNNSKQSLRCIYKCRFLSILVS